MGKHVSHRSYWKWKPFKKKDNWIPLLKPGRKTWTIELDRTKIEVELWTIINYISFWKSKITHEDNITKWIKPHTPLTIWQACKELWIPYTTFYGHLNKFPSLKVKYNEMRENSREYVRQSAECNIEKAVTWGLDLTDKEVVDVSFKMLEKTDKNYNPKIEIETKSIWINLNKTSDDLLADLSAILWLKTNS